MRKSFVKRAAPLHASTNTVSAAPAAVAPAAAAAPRFASPAVTTASASVEHEAIYRDPSKKKNGSLDGRLALEGTRATLFDEESKLLVARALKKDETAIVPGSLIKMGKWEVEVGALSAASTGAVATSAGSAGVAAAASAAAIRAPARAPDGLSTRAVGSVPTQRLRSPAGAAAPPPPPPPRQPPGAFRPPTSSSGGFRAPPAAASSKLPDDAFVLNREDADARPVIVDRQLARALRPHQREAVQFLWDCVSGRRSAGLSGCILAHSMGLGKSLSALTLLFTLLKTGPTAASERAGTIRKALIVCPASLCKNWEKEVKRWLPQRLRPTLLPPGDPASAAEAVRLFATVPPQQLLILSYEAVRAHVDALETAPIGLLVCDEGHRIKAAAGNQTIDALKRLVPSRRVLLTGTPLQNDLSEFWTMCDFVNPGALGSLAAFSREYATPIARGRQPNASTAEREHADEAMQRLRELTDRFVQRRGSAVLAALLPPRTETVLFARLSAAQAAAYKRTLREHTAACNPLPTITKLRAICACASAEGDGGEDDGGGVGFDASAGVSEAAAVSAKIALLMQLLAPIRAANEQVVVCSGFMKSLDALQRALTARGWGSLRLDGSTPLALRQEHVDRFNSRSSDAFVFLLSTRAGGTGFNLIGANRLVLLDPDWNPANDEQAAARVYRDGQRRSVHIWRMLSTGTVEERIYQRQIFKRGLNALVDEQPVGEHAPPSNDAAVSSSAAAAGGTGSGAGAGRSGFSQEELREIFTFDEAALSTTIETLLQHDMMRLGLLTDERAWVAGLSDPLLARTLADDAALRRCLSFACDASSLEQIAQEVGARAAHEDEVDDEEDDEEEGEGQDATSLPPPTPESSVDGDGAGAADIDELELDESDDEQRAGAASAVAPIAAAPKKRKHAIVSSDEEDADAG